MKRNLDLVAVATALLTFATQTWAGGGIADVEGARAQERAGRGLTRQEIDTIDRYGGNDDLYDRGYGYVAPLPWGFISLPAMVMALRRLLRVPITRAHMTMTMRIKD